ncbi:putative PepSY-like beta-lactamase-inhibitor [Dysgonomonas alginatilytica]|uniref:Putative PepSY-like beta-lactamase-inhibitor n=1 Tax=Dysgonomonas alginatilytica TaxID=1605892 RepID=A0A2V3PW38_9BACT|nr:PepSY-like domain-containing protein [Dysgonomonas alginatilytica]PXV69051.1 putative PepSY-like beta-lactamase-inhibitor [Dysgonomonas alginatilytica]
MKTPKLLYLILAVLISGFTACSSDDEGNTISINELPDETRSFINTYLPDHQTVKIEDLKPQGTDLDKYKVTFSNDFTIIFNTEGYWICAESESKLPESLIEALDYIELKALKAKYANLEIKGIYNNTPFRRKIVLADNTPLFLYYDSNAIAVASDLTEDLESVPQKIKDFIARYYSDMYAEYIIHATESNSNEVYKVSLQKKVSTKMSVAPKLSAQIEFDKNGDWNLISNVNFNISEDIWATFPQHIIDKWAKDYPNTPIIEVRRDIMAYHLRINSSYMVIIDAESDTQPFRADVVQEFIYTHFVPNTTSFLNMSITKNQYSNPRTRKCKIDVAGYNIEIDAYIDGSWQTLQVEKKPMPLSIFDTLPIGIKTVLTEKQITQQTKKITKETDGGYSVEAANTVYKFDSNGNLLS